MAIDLWFFDFIMKKSELWLVQTSDVFKTSGVSLVSESLKNLVFKELSIKEKKNDVDD